MSAKTIEDEIDEIRLKIYEKIKDMTPQETTEYYRKSGQETAKKYGLKIYYSLDDECDIDVRPSERGC